ELGPPRRVEDEGAVRAVGEVDAAGRHAPRPLAIGEHQATVHRNTPDVVEDPGGGAAAIRAFLFGHRTPLLQDVVLTRPPPQPAGRAPLRRAAMHARAAANAASRRDSRCSGAT